MKASSAKGTETKLRIMRAAADLFHKQGVRATSPDQIIEASATGKGQFYHYFKNKEGLVHEVLQSYLEEIKTNTAPLNYEIESWEDLEQWFLAQVALQKSFNMTRGCPFGTVGNEVTDNDELVRLDLNLIYEVIKNKLATFFVKERARGRLIKDANEDWMADFCIATIQGAMLMGKIKRNSQTVETTIHEALTHLQRYAVTPRKPVSTGRRKEGADNHFDSKAN
jgi:AcrR family transcriptional regulator